ncbi:Oxysterol-binding protein OBPa [Saitoella coloradoensis]
MVLGRSDKVETGEDVEQLEDEGKNIILGIISQLRPGMDLTRVTLPTFILEPRSMLERITNFMSHPELILPIHAIDDPVERFVSVCRYYLSGFHIKPPGVKKPLNPVLGEQFTCEWTFPDGTQALYLAEQVSHHPPVSAYFYASPEHKIRVDGTLIPKSRFLGNSVGSMMEGKARLSFTDRPGEEYVLTQPNMYARGILFGTMKLELGDHSFIRCDKNDLVADIEFKTKGFISGTYNAISGKIKRISTGEALYEISGKWNEEMTLRDLRTKKTTILFDARSARPAMHDTKPISEQDERESQRLWEPVTRAIKKRDQEAATDAKSAIEERQRQEQRRREAEGVQWEPRFFVRRPGTADEWILKEDVDFFDDPEKVKADIRAITSTTTTTTTTTATPTKPPAPQPGATPSSQTATTASPTRTSGGPAHVPAIPGTPAMASAYPASVPSAATGPTGTPTAVLGGVTRHSRIPSNSSDTSDKFVDAPEMPIHDSMSTLQLEDGKPTRRRSLLDKVGL